MRYDPRYPLSGETYEIRHMVYAFAWFCFMIDVCKEEGYGYASAVIL